MGSGPFDEPDGEAQQSHRECATPEFVVVSIPSAYDDNLLSCRC